MKAYLIDDEVHCLVTLADLLAKHCPDVEVIGTFSDPVAATSSIRKKAPDLLFLDVEMKGMSGFELLEQFPADRFAVIFTTAFSQYAIRAIRFGAMDFLMKPIDAGELISAVNRMGKKALHSTAAQLEAIKSNIGDQTHYSLRKIAFPSLQGFEIIPLQDIVAVESNDNYCKIYLRSKKTLTVSRTLKDVGELLDQLPFFRLHKSFLVNLDYTEKYIRGEGGFLELAGNLSFPVSRTRKEELLSIIARFTP